MRFKLLTGLVWITGATVIGRMAGFVTQIVLGWLLTKEDFGVYAIVLSTAIAVAALRNGGTQQLLIQKGSEYEKLGGPVLKFASTFNVLAAILLILASFIADRHYQIESLVPMTMVMATAIILGSPVVLLRAKLAIDARFRELSISLAISDITRQLLTMGFALVGFGAFSFTLPLIFEPAVLFLLFYSFIGSLPKLRSSKASEYYAIFMETRWIMLSNLAIALRLNGQYFAISLFETPAVLGIFFFGSQLITSVTAMISVAVNEVLFPGMSKMTNDPILHADVFQMMVKSALIIGCTITVLVIMLAPSVVNFLWAGRWDDASEVVVVLSMAISPIVVSTIAFATLASKALWGQRLIALLAAALGELAVAGISAWHSDSLVVAQALVAFRWISAAILVTYVGRTLRPLGIRDLQSFIRWFIVPLSLMALAYVLHFGPSDTTKQMGQVAILVVFISGFGMFYKSSRSLWRRMSA